MILSLIAHYLSDRAAIKIQKFVCRTSSISLWSELHSENGFVKYAKYATDLLRTGLIDIKAVKGDNKIIKIMKIYLKKIRNQCKTKDSLQDTMNADTCVRRNEHRRERQK